MATVNETIVTGRKFRKLVDEATKLWQRISFWTKASDVEFNDGSTAETKMGAINGITDSLVSTSSNVAASAKALSTLSNKLTQVRTYVGADGKLHSVDGTGADTVLNFSNSLPDPLRIIGETNVNMYPSIPTFGRNIRLTCNSVESSHQPTIYMSNQIDFSILTATAIGKLQKAIVDIEAKEYKYLIIKYTSGTSAKLNIEIEWI